MTRSTIVAIARRALEPIPAEYEIYSVSARFKAPAAVAEGLCWACFKWVQPGEAIREVRLRKAGTSFVGRIRHAVHAACLEAARDELRAARGPNVGGTP